MLPDVTAEDWNQYEADNFNRGATNRIEAMTFSSAADQRISDLGQLNTGLGDVPQASPQPPQPTQPVEGPAAPAEPSVPPEPAQGPQGPMPADAPVLDLSKPPPYAPDAPIATPSPGSSVTAPPPQPSAPSNLVTMALEAATDANIDPGLFAGLVGQESSWNPTARSSVGARGLTQLMPDTARGLGVNNVDDPQENLRGGARYLKSLLDRYNGDTIKALAAYNAGPGAVDKYGGVPPFKETQTYVDNIMGSLAQNQGGVGSVNPSTGGPAVVPDATQAAKPGRDISQFGDPQLTSEEAYAACGPAAAVRFAARFGRNPTLREATDLARSVGWTPGQGMAGLGSEKNLMDKLNVPTKLVQGAQWDVFAREAQTGNPVTISTAGHYFTADGYNPDTGAFHVGRSGLDLKGGSEWMTPAQMQRLMGTVQGGLLADNPSVPSPSTADQDTNPGAWLGRQKDALVSSISDAAGNVSNAVSSTVGSLFPRGGTVTPSVGDVVGGVANDVLGATGLARTGQEGITQGPSGEPVPDYRAAEQAGRARLAPRGISLEPQGLTPLNPDVTQVPSILRGPVLKTDQEILDETSPQGIQVARQTLALVGNRNPTDAQIADALRSESAGFAYAGSTTGESGGLLPGVSRMFHGTGSDFPRPDPGKFDPNGLFGPGYYLTSSPEVAGGVARTADVVPQPGDMESAWANVLGPQNPANQRGALVQPGYAQARAAESAGPNVRAVDVPSNLRLLDAEAPADPVLLRGASIDLLTRPGTPTNGDLYVDLTRKFGSGAKVNEFLAQQGFDGIQYAGGTRIPMTDAAGQAIEHTAVVVFPKSLDKIRNAISGRQGGQAQIGFATQLGGAAAGGATGYATTPENASPQERIARTVGGAALGFGATYGAGRIIENPALLRTRQRAMADPNFATFGLGNLFPEGESTVERPTGAPATPEQLQSTIDSLGQQWQDLGNEIRSLHDQAASAFNPGLKQQLTNRAEMLQKNQDDIMRTVQYIDEHNALPVNVNPAAGLAETIPSPRAQEPPLPPQNPGIDDATLRNQGQMFGETQAAKKAAQLPRSELPPGARPIDMTPAENVARLRLEQWPEEIRGTIEDAAQARDFGQTQRRGVLPDAVSEQMADDLGRPLDQWIKSAKAGKAYNAEELRALRNAVGAQAANVRQVASDVRTARSSGNLTDNLLVKQFSEGQKLQAMTEILSGAQAEWGRAGRAFQGAARLVDLPPDEATARIYKMVGGRDNAIQVMDEYQKLLDSGADVIAQAKFWSNVKNPPPGVTDWFKLIRYNSMLSGPRSFEVNAIGNALELPWRFARDVGASIVRGRPEELKTELTGVFAGLATANRRFMETLAHGITAEAAAAGEIPQSVSSRTGNPVGRGVATALEVPGRLMGGADEWAQAIAYSMGLGRLAARQASREGLNSTAWRERVSEILSEPTAMPNLMKQADGIAQRMTYHGDMGMLGQGLQAFTQRTGIIGNLVLPFLRTVYHITARGIDRSPAGLIGTGVDVARGVYGRTPAELGAALSGDAGKALPKGVAPLGERLGDNLIGSTIFAGFYKEAADGNISGAGPDDPQRRALLQSEGWQPYSVRLGDNWVSYANWGPVAIPLSMSAAAAEAQRYSKPGAQAQDIILDGMRRTAQVATQQTYLQSIGAAWLGLTDPKRYGFQWVNNTISSLIPYGAAINTLGQATDEVARRPDRFDIGDAIRYRLPANTPIIGGRETVPESQDVLGRPVPNLTAGLRALDPLRVSPERPDPVLRELDAVGIAPPGPPQSITRGSLSLDLTPDEQRQVHAAAGDLIAQRVGRDIASESYGKLNDAGKHGRLQAIIDAARTQAEDQFLKTLPVDQLRQRRAQGEAKRVPIPVGGR